MYNGAIRGRQNGNPGMIRSIRATGSCATKGEYRAERRAERQRNNVGNVWVIATCPGDAAHDAVLRTRVHLFVTVQLYMRWEPPAVEQQ